MQLLRRRDFLKGTTAAGAASVTVGCSYNNTAYNDAASALRRPLPQAPSALDLIRFATLAANGHNTQPWIFEAKPLRIDISPDFSRRTPVVDPDDHHLFASLGCAAENLSLATAARGMSGAVFFDADRAQIDLGSSNIRETTLFRAIPRRQCSRTLYDGSQASNAVIGRLSKAATRYGVIPLFIPDEPTMESIIELVVSGNIHQMDDPAFVSELRDWIRFNADSALLKRDGLYSAVSGNPSLPDWLGSLAFRFLYKKQGENEKYTRQVRSSAGVVVFVAATDDRLGWFNAGRAYQRFALQATVEGLQQSFINQAVEVPKFRGELRALLGLGDKRPNLLVRFGIGAAGPMSLRRLAQNVTL